MSITLIGLFPVAVILTAFVLGLRTGILTLILIRPLCDRLFESGRFEVAGSTISNGALINVVVICAMLFNIGQIWRRVPSGLRTIWLPFLALAFFAIFYSPVQVDGFRKFLTYVTFSGMFMFSFVVVKLERDVLLFLKLVIWSSVLPVFYGLFQTVSGIDWFLESRVHSTFSHPNIFAFYIVAIIGTIFFVLSSSHVRVSGRLRIILNAYLIPLLILLIMTKTRNAWICCLVLFLVYGVAYDRRALIFVLVAPALALAVPAVSERVMELASGNYYIGGGANLNAFAWRQILWENSLFYIWQQPIFGFGLESFHFYSPLFFQLEPNGTFAHNIYIQLLFETGLIGLTSYLWIFWRSYARLIRYWRFDRRGVTMAAGIMGAYLISCYSDNILDYLSLDWCFWFSFGLIFAQLARARAAGMGKRKVFGKQLIAEGMTSIPTGRPGLAS